MWMLTLPVLFGQLILMYVDHRHAAGSFGSDKVFFTQLGWILKNPQIYAVAIPVLGFAADVLVTGARIRLNARGVVLTAIGAFGVLSFGAYLVSSSDYAAGSPVTVVMGLLGPLPVLAILAISGDLVRRGKGAVTAGAAYAVSALLLLLLGTVAGAIGAIPQTDAAGTIFDVGVNHAVVLAAVIAGLGGLHWWATKILRQPAKESLGLVAPLLLFIGSVGVVLPDLIAGLWGTGKELTPDWTGGMKGLNVLVLLGAGLVGAGLVLALVALLPALKSADDVPADPWEGQTLEWLAPSPPPLDNFVGAVPTVTSAEPLIDLREEK
jgi:heme/copper-type cytochrome/quinol oxidase subunit 1